MSARFTPGPWCADWWYSIIRDLHNQPGLECGEDDAFGYPGWQGDNTANANLIAAAPDLYAALIELGSMVATTAMPEAACERLFPVCMKAKAALAKARGETSSADTQPTPGSSDE